ncbi:kinesin heavy chain-like isoform X2 [Oscarella lobularis]
MEGSMDDPNLQGIIPRMVNGIFQYIYNMEEDVEFHIKVSYFEIYMERIRDLLDVSKTNLVIHEDKNRVPYVKGVTERFVSSPEEIFLMIEEAKANRHVAVTNMNEHSSRSHSVFLINVRQDNLASQKKLSGKLYLVDLAGSEKVSKTGAEGLVLEEAKNINKSLSALGNVISALADGNKGHVPYRDSKLTRILQESLGGNARTTVIICCSPSSVNETETRGTLLFGQRAKSIKNTIVINEELSAEEWKQRYEKEKAKNARLSVTLGKLENELNRWRRGESVSAKEQLDWKLEGSEVEERQMQSLSVSEKAKFEEEIEQLIAQLDGKDEEISSKAQEIEQMTAERSELQKFREMDRDAIDKLNDKLTSESDRRRKAEEETRDVMQALEELAMNYDTKAQEANDQSKDNENLQRQIGALQETIDVLKKKKSQAESAAIIHQKKAGEMIGSLHVEMVDFAGLLRMGVDDLQPPDLSKVDAEFTKLRLYFSQTKAVVGDLVKAEESLRAQRESSDSKAQRAETELASCQLLISQNEAKVQTLTESLLMAEKKKRDATEELDELRDLLSQLKSQEKVRDVSAHDREREKEQALLIRSALEEELDIHRDAHQKQVATLRDDVRHLEERLQNSQEDVQKKDALLQAIRNDYGKQGDLLKERTAELDRVRTEIVSRDKAKKELNALEETVSKELQSLARLRREVYEDIQSRLKADDGDAPSSVESQRIAFLETNLDRLTQVHKQIVRDNNEFRNELPKMERRLAAKSERIQQLEEAIREMKEKDRHERQKLTKEIQSLEKAYETRQRKGRSGFIRQASIAKPIRPGQQPPHTSVAKVIRSGPATNDPWRPIASPATTSPTGRTNPFFAGPNSGASASGRSNGTSRRQLPVVNQKEAVYVVDLKGKQNYV